MNYLNLKIRTQIFKLVECWTLLKIQPKWIGDCQQECAKRTKVFESGQQTSYGQSNSSSNADISDNKVQEKKKWTCMLRTWRLINGKVDVLEKSVAIHEKEAEEQIRHYKQLLYVNYEQLTFNYLFYNFI